MKNIKYFLPVLVEILQVPFIIIMFKVIENRQLAGVLGGIFFLIIGFGLISHFYKMLYTKSLSIWVLMGHLFIFVIPIFVARVSFWGTPFEDIVFMGIKPSLLHDISEKYYVLVLWAGIYDCMRITRHEGKPYFNEETGQPQLDI